MKGGILCAPPCTHLSRAGAQYWDGKGESALLEAMSVVDACLRAVVVYRPSWWALENPVGRLSRFLGPPAMRFHPYEFGDPWTKRTWLWGRFCPPVPLVSCAARVVKPVLGDITTKGTNCKNRRSQTPPGFARAFFEANH